MARKNKKQKKKKDRRKVKDVLGDMGDKIGNGVRKVIKNTGQNIGNLVHDVGNAAQWLALAPFKGPMSVILRSRGIPVPRKVDDVAKTFYTQVIHKKHFEQHFTVHQAAVKLGRHSAAMRDHFLASHFEAQGNFDHIAPAVVAAVIPIIQGIVKWFKERKEMRAAGATLPPDEERALNEYEETMDGDTRDPRVGYQRPGANPGMGSRPGADDDYRGGTTQRDADEDPPPSGGSGGGGGGGGGDDEGGVSLITIIMIAAALIAVVVLIAVLA